MKVFEYIGAAPVIRVIFSPVRVVLIAGPECTVGGTIFEMWLGTCEPAQDRDPAPAIVVFRGRRKQEFSE